MNFDIFPTSTQILSHIGISHWALGLNLSTIFDTWVALAFLILVVWLVRRSQRRGMNPVSFAAEMYVEYFYDMCKEAFGYADYRHFSFITSLFTFTFLGNVVGIFPFVAETTKDLNTAIVIGLLSFIYVQREKIRVHGWGEFFHEYIKVFHFKPRIIAVILSVVVSILLVPFALLGEFAKVISLSFRLFGNILGGAVLFEVLLLFLRKWQIAFIMIILGSLCGAFILKYLCGATSGRPALNKFFLFLLGSAFAVTGIQAFFCIFEGLIQAYVVTTLTVTYLAVAVGKEEDHVPGVS